MADRGYYRRHMLGYIRWIADHIPELLVTLGPRYHSYRREAQKKLTGARVERDASSAAFLMIGYDLHEGYIRSLMSGEDELPDADALRDRNHPGYQEREQAWKDIISNIVENAQDKQGLEADREFVENINAMISSGFAQVLTSAENADGTMRRPPKDLIGYMDSEYYYLIPKAAYQKSYEFGTRSGGTNHLTQVSLKRKLLESGLMIGQKRVGRKGIPNNNYWVFARTVIDGEKPAEEKQMDMMDDAIPVTDVQVPF